MPAPLLAVDAPSLLYRAFFALPKTITGADGQPVNALLGCANLVLQAVERHDPRAVVFCFGAEAAHYRVELLDLPRGPPRDAAELVGQWADAPAFFAAFGFTVLAHDELEADDLLGALAAAESDAGGQPLLFTGDRDMFQCVSESVTVIYPAGRGKGEPELVDVAGVRRRYGITPEQVPDFIALRGDPSDGIPGAKGIGEKTAAELLQEHGDLDTLLALPIGLRPRVRQSLEDGADDLRAFRHIATLQPVDVERPADAQTTSRQRQKPRKSGVWDVWRRVLRRGAAPDRELLHPKPLEEECTCSNASRRPAPSTRPTAPAVRRRRPPVDERPVDERPAATGANDRVDAAAPEQRACGRPRDPRRPTTRRATPRSPAVRRRRGRGRRAYHEHERKRARDRP